MFETLRTAVKMMISSLNQNALIGMGVCIFLLMIVWSVLSLLFNNQNTLRKNCKDVMYYMKSNSITVCNYVVFTSFFAKFPIAFRYGWKRYEQTCTGKPSNYLKQGECVDTYVNGGFGRQATALMKTVIFVTVAFITICSIAIIGIATPKSTTNVEITTTTLVDALIVPFCVYILLMLNYHIYKAVRHHQYRTTIETFYDFLDYLDEKIDLEDLFGKGSRTISLFSNVYTNETLQDIVEERIRARKVVENSKKNINNGLTNLRGGVLGAEDVRDSTGENVIEEFGGVSNKLASADNVQTPIQSGSMIKTEVEFVEVVGQVENLLDEIEKEKDKKKRTETEKVINEKMRLLTEYKQRAKIVNEQRIAQAKGKMKR